MSNATADWDVVLRSLWHWRHVDETRRDRAKRFLMPDDDVDVLGFEVTEHPGLNENHEIVLDWCEVQVYDVRTRVYVCRIVVGSDRTAQYTFH